MTMTCSRIARAASTVVTGIEERETVHRVAKKVFLKIQKTFSSEKVFWPPETSASEAPLLRARRGNTRQERKGVWGKQEFPPSIFIGVPPTKMRRFRRLDADEIARERVDRGVVLRHRAGSNAGAVTNVPF